MMNIGIIGINIHTVDLNPGAVLHAWAFQRYILRFNEVKSADIIDYIPQHVKDRIGPDLFKQYLEKKDLKNALKSLIYRKSYKNRYEKFCHFVENHMKLSENRYDSFNGWESLNTEYQCLIVESDVVWAKHNGEFNPVFFLAIPSMKNMIKVAYATDIGNLKIQTPADKHEFVKLLSNVDYISCRGRHAEVFLKQYTNKNVVALIDPTLLLHTVDFNQICAPPRREAKYLYCYYIDYDKRLIKFAKEYAKKHGLQYIGGTSRITKENLFKFDRHAYSIGVEDFISEIKYADVVMTNSFHACCISIQYHRNLFAFPRRDENKVIDLLQQLGMRDRYIFNYEIKNESKINYEQVDLILDAEREKSREWLSMVLYNNVTSVEICE